MKITRAGVDIAKALSRGTVLIAMTNLSGRLS